MKKKLLIISTIVVLVEILTIVFLSYRHGGNEKYEIVFENEELLINTPGKEIESGFYCQGDMGKGVLIQTPQFDLPSGIYKVAINYMSKGQARSYKSDALETQSFYGKPALPWDEGFCS